MGPPTDTTSDADAKDAGPHTARRVEREGKMGDPRIDSLHDPYEDQLSAARYKAERDQLRQRMDALEEWSDDVEDMYRDAFNKLTDETKKSKRLGKLVWRLQNRLARSHRRERNLRKGMREWREKVIGAPVRTMSAYDLLPEEDLQSLRWVREHGGLDAVRMSCGHADNRRVELCSALGIDLDTGWSDAMVELDRRLMPEGYEWPRYESGEPLRYKDRYITDGAEHEVWHVDFDSYGDATILNDDCSKCSLDKGERVKHPAVLAADGEPLEVGQTVWSANTGEELEVVGFDGDYVKCRYDGAAPGIPVHGSWHPHELTHQRPVLDADGNRIEPAMDVWWVCEGDERGVHAEKLHVESIGEDGLVTCDPFNGGTWVELEPSELYVHKPVLDADGVPIREGDTVYSVEHGTEYTVCEVGLPRVTVEYWCAGISAHSSIVPNLLTHERPDSWERIKADAATFVGHVTCRDMRREDAAETLREMMKLLYRCKALTERRQ